MAFNVIAKIGDPIPTAKDNETISVQVVQVTNNAGVARNRVEARIFVDNSAQKGYCGPTKNALTFDSETDIDSLIAALEAAKGHIALGTVQNVQVVKPRRKQAAAKLARA